MPPFVYPEVNYGAAAAIPGIIEQGGQQQAQALLQAAQARAQGQLGAGQAWGQGLQSLGNLVGNIPGIYAQQAEGKIKAAEAGMRMTQLGLQVQKAQRDQAAEQAWTKAWGNQDNLGEADDNGLRKPDPQKVYDEVAGKGFVTQANGMLEGINRTNLTSTQVEEGKQKIAEGKQKIADGQTDALANLGHAVKVYADANPDASDEELRDYTIGLGSGAFYNNHVSADQLRQLQKDLATTDRTGILAKADQLLAASPRVQDTISKQAKEAAETEHFKAETEKLRRPTPLTEAEQKAYRDSLYQKQERFKAGVGPDLSAGEKADLAGFEAAKTAELAPAEEAKTRETARAKIENEVNKPYSFAQGAVRQIRQLVADARAGNEIAGSLQGLTTTMATLASLNYHRLNTNELNTVGQAGSWWQRVKNYIYGATTGQKLNPEMQADLLKYADSLDKLSQIRYSKDFHDNVELGHLENDPMVVPSVGPAKGDIRPDPAGGMLIYSGRGRDRGWHHFTPTTASPEAPPGAAPNAAPPNAAPPPNAPPGAALSAAPGAAPVVPPAAAPAAPGAPKPMGTSGIREQVKQEARRQGVNDNVAAAVAWVESRFNQGAKSNKGAIGTMQLMPATAKAPGGGITPGNPYDLGDNIRVGVSYLKMLLSRYGGNLDKALAAYNTGMDTVDRYGITAAGRDYVNLVHAAMRQELMRMHGAPDMLATG